MLSWHQVTSARLNQHTLQQLREALKAKGLTTTGCKDELVKR
jgi:hypothetical protein